MERSLRWARRHKQIVFTALAVLSLALIAGSAIVGLQARKTETVSRERLTYIRDSFPLIDTITMEAHGGGIQGSDGAERPGDPCLRAGLESV